MLECDNAIGKYLSQRFAIKETDKTIFQQAFARVSEALAQGDTVVSSAELPPYLENLIISAEQAKQGLAAPLVRDEQHLWLQRIWQSERQLATLLMQRQQMSAIAFKTDLAPYLDGLKPAQQQAVQHAAHHHLTLINGGPGTGKTYTVSRIVQALIADNPEIRIALAAPTGKAAKRMEESLQNALNATPEIAANIFAHIQDEAQTLHRLLGMGNRGMAQYHYDNPLPYDLIIIDEASMLSLELARLLLDAVPEQARLILLGDAEQLAAVEPGAVLHDISQHPRLAAAVITLQESERFSAESGIGRLAALTLSPPSDAENQLHQLFASQADIQRHEIAATLYQTLAQPYQEYFQMVATITQAAEQSLTQLFQCFDRYRILTAGHHSPLGDRAINQQIQRAHCRANGIHIEQSYYHGQPLMITANDYHNGLFNGDIGIVLYQEQQYQLYFPQRAHPVPLAHLHPEQLQLAYALTIHKSQGSEYEQVALCLDPKQEQGLSRELLYTGITRAKKSLSIYASLCLLSQIMHSPTCRSTGLHTFLSKSCSTPLS